MLNKILDRFEEILISFFMALSTVLIFLSVLYRYTSDIPWIWYFTQRISFTWAQELSIYLLIWMAKFGAAYGVRVGAHIGVDVLVRKLPENWRHRFEVFGCLAGAFFTFVIAFLGSKFVIFIYSTGQRSPDLELPMWIVYLAIPAASWLMCYRFLQMAHYYRKNKKYPYYE
jgi:C4-dicarboxylate transporter DctQ subunit